MPAYLVLNYDVNDRAALDAYRTAAASAIVGATGELRASTDATTHLTEAPAAGSHTVILEFPSVETALERYYSVAYQDVIGQRLSATSPKFAFVVPSI